MSDKMPKIPESLSEWTDEIKATIKPFVSIRLTANAPENIWASRIGGQAFLPSNMQIPVDIDGEEMPLLAQINLDECPSLAGFPNGGLLQFYVREEMAGAYFPEEYNDDYWNAIVSGQYSRVVYLQSVPSTEQPDELTCGKFFNPEDMDEFPTYGGCYGMEFSIKQEYVNASASPEFEAFYSTTGSEEDVFDFGINYDESFSEDDNYTGGSEHKLGGYPAFTQGDIRVTADAGDWVLLFQLDSTSEPDDDDVGLMWGDAGIGNFFIHRDDLAKLDFSRVAFSWDCH
ncbi:YwqG family protein [Parathalassolituus penaei]|uniref:DUF1963 domain-containing protein n=1 Tax=Parathalassolituus penaei TaxID=2997323 RepID=A0A9X3EHP6_9GAMM|nr:DUF1963 domain-containing protein [Parathalassolituus penaei]MCY0967410.1 DUF1963 domain-containing protein [Parathalassolituus penaei]